MLYTRKGDDGTTSAYGCNQRFSKSSAIAEALGSVDEINSFVGVLRSHRDLPELSIKDTPLVDILVQVQQSLFIIQAELAGADKTIDEKRVKGLEEYTNFCEENMPKIQSFYLPGADEISAMFDLGRTVSRRAERRVIAVLDEKSRPLGEYTLGYLNRLSSLLYAIVRYINFKSGVEEIKPEY